MNENTSPNSNHNFPTPKVRSLVWQDLPDCSVMISRTIMSSDEAIVIVAGREQVRMFLFRESLRGYVDVMVDPGKIPSDRALLAMGRTIMAHLAALAEGRDVT